MVEGDTRLDRESIVKELRDRGVSIHECLSSVVLIGGKGTRLDVARKIILKENFVELDEKYLGEEGPKGLAMLNCQSESGTLKKPMTDWHLDIHAMCPQVKEIVLSLGTSAEMVMDYYSKRYRDNYEGRPLSYLIERNPAGTIAPIVKLQLLGELPDKPLILANGDNLIDADFYDCYLTGCLYAARLGIDINELVIDVLSFVPWEESNNYGTVDVDFTTGLVRGFKEKSGVNENVHLNLQGREMTPINSGFSIIVNPARLFGKYLTKEVIETSTKLENGELEYKGNETIVKYETLYGAVAKEGRMVGVYTGNYWTDLGTEEKLIAAENAIPNTRFFSKVSNARTLLPTL